MIDVLSTLGNHKKQKQVKILYRKRLIQTKMGGGEGRRREPSNSWLYFVLILNQFQITVLFFS